MTEAKSTTSTVAACEDNSAGSQVHRVIAPDQNLNIIQSVMILENTNNCGLRILSR